MGHPTAGVPVRLPGEGCDAFRRIPQDSCRQWQKPWGMRRAGAPASQIFPRRYAPSTSFGAARAAAGEIPGGLPKVRP